MSSVKVTEFNDSILLSLVEISLFANVNLAIQYTVIVSVDVVKNGFKKICTIKNSFAFTQ